MQKDRYGISREWRLEERKQSQLRRRRPPSSSLARKTPTFVFASSSFFESKCIKLTHVDSELPEIRVELSGELDEGEGGSEEVGVTLAVDFLVEREDRPPVLGHEHKKEGNSLEDK